LKHLAVVILLLVAVNSVSAQEVDIKMLLAFGKSTPAFIEKYLLTRGYKDCNPDPKGNAGHPLRIYCYSKAQLKMAFLSPDKPLKDISYFSDDSAYLEQTVSYVLANGYKYKDTVNEFYWVNTFFEKEPGRPGPDFVQISKRKPHRELRMSHKYFYYIIYSK
jgi:hypothetical protein